MMEPRNPTRRRMGGLLRTGVVAPTLLALVAAGACTSGQVDEADLLLTGGVVWTGEEERPRAGAVAVREGRILAVGSASELARHRGSGTRVVELAGRFVAPGFIDNHTHFNQAGALLLGVNLLSVSNEEGLVREVRAAAQRMPEGAWILGGDWGAYEAWARGSTGEEEQGGEPFRPHRALIDSITPAHPALLSRWDRTAHLANTRALEASGADCGWAGVECVDGEPTGRLTTAAFQRIRDQVPPKSMEQRLREARLALEDLASLGVTTIHDNTPPDQFPVFEALRDRGELTARVYARPTLDRVDSLIAAGARPGDGDDWIRMGGLKGFVDGIMGNSSARFYQPYLNTGELGVWRPMMDPPGNMERLLLTADSAGWTPQVHAIGDHAIDTLLTIFDRVLERNAERERRFRIIHTQVVSGPEVASRMADRGFIAEVQPYHAIDDMRWMELRIGERARWAYPFRTLDEAGVLLSFGSDWPGTNASWYPASPALGMYAAVTRQTLDGEPAGGWFPEERVDVETALRAYTVNNAWAEHAEDRKGRIQPGFLADLVVLDRNPLDIPGSELKEVQVDLTVVDGRIVHRRAN